MTKADTYPDLKFCGVGDFVLWLLRRLKRYRITGNSMVPTLSAGEEVLASPIAHSRRAIVPGEILVTHHPYIRDELLIKRVQEISADGGLILQGDNPGESTDSRSFGAVPTHLMVSVRIDFSPELSFAAVGSPWR